MGAEGVEIEGCTGLGAKTVHTDFRGWSRSSKIKIVGTCLRWNYRFVFRCSEKAGEDECTLGTRGFSCEVSGFGQVLKKVTRAKSLWTRAPSL